MSRTALIFLTCLWGFSLILTPSFVSADEASGGDDAESADGFIDSPAFIVPKIIEPYLQITVPGLNLKDTIVIGNGENDCPKDMLCTDIIGRYLNAIFRWAAGAGVVFTIVLVMIGGAQYMTGSATGQTQKGLERMRGAAIGLVILLSVSAILTFVNPAIALLKPLQLDVVKPNHDLSIATRLGGTPAATCFAEDGDVVRLEGEHLTGSSDKMCDAIGDRINAAADALARTTGKNIRIADGYRSAADQAAIWVSKCYGKKTCSVVTCDPFPRDATSPITHEGGTWQLKPSLAEQYTTTEEVTSYLKQVATQNPKQACPHLTGFAADLWCGNSGNYIADISCHIQMEEALRQQGFCRIYHEGWHFEYGPNATSGAAIKCDWITGRTLISAEHCNKDVHIKQAISSSEIRDCVFDYSACPNRADIKRGKCVN